MRDREKKQIRVVELFAGVGGFRLGLERCAPDVFHTVWANQWEPGQLKQWAYRCYTQRFGPEHRCVNEDIATALHETPEHDFLVGGFPCQDFSVARTRATGMDGKKGALWWSINTIIKDRRPRFVLLENVDRLLRSPAAQRGRDFGIILKCLDTAGYGAEWRVLNAAEYGCVQRRRRTFLLAFREDTAVFRRLADCYNWRGHSQWLHSDGFFAAPFPVIPPDSAGLNRDVIDLRDYAELSDVWTRFRADFRNGGALSKGRVFTEALSPVPPLKSLTLDDVVIHGTVDERFFIRDGDLPRWKYLKGPKRIDRISRETGFAYHFSEGGIAFPDPLDRPARTMLTSEGTVNRSTHVIADPLTGRLRRLTPEECEAVNGFDRGWTEGMPERQRYFVMGNALVVPLVEKMGTALIRLLA